ncbi:hypothetical protein, partial [Enterobacter hormaechei]
LSNSTMKPYSGKQVEDLITEVHRLVCVNQITPENYLRAALTLLYQGMAATNTVEHGLNDEDGVALLHVKRYI